MAESANKSKQQISNRQLCQKWLNLQILTDTNLIYLSPAIHRYYPYSRLKHTIRLNWTKLPWPFEHLIDSNPDPCATQNEYINLYVRCIKAILPADIHRGDFCYWLPRSTDPLIQPSPCQHTRRHVSSPSPISHIEINTNKGLYPSHRIHFSSFFSLFRRKPFFVCWPKDNEQTDKKKKTARTHANVHLVELMARFTDCHSTSKGPFFILHCELGRGLRSVLSKLWIYINR